MLNARLASGRPFEVLHSPVLQVAVEQTASHFVGELAEQPAAKKCHTTIALALKAAVEEGVAPEHRFSGRDGGNGQLDVVTIGKKAFPMVVRQLKFGQTAIELYPPAALSKLDLEAAQKDGVLGLYGEKKKEDLDRLVVIRDHGPSTDLVVKTGQPIKDVTYAWALFEVASSVLRRATAPKPAESVKGFDPALGIDVERKAPPTPGAQLASALVSGKFDGVRAANGPALAHELLGAFTHRGQTIVVTARRGTGEGVRVYVETEAGWRSLPIPADAAWPVGGVTPVQVGDRLHFFGGVDAHGDVLASHFALDLGKLGDPRPEMFERRRDLDSPTAWAAAVQEGRDVFIGGGVAGFMVKAGERRQREKILHNGFGVFTRDGLKTRAPAPGDLLRSFALSHGGCLFFGPGDARDGKVRVYDNTQGGAWMVLPDLPEAVGLGQLFVDGTTLYYAGGFSADGRPRGAIYALDLSDPNAAWAHLGESPYCAGLSRLVAKNGVLQSLMIAPGGHSAVYTLEARD